MVHKDLVDHSNLVSDQILHHLGRAADGREAVLRPRGQAAKFAPLGVPREDLDVEPFEYQESVWRINSINILNQRVILSYAPWSPIDKPS